VSLIEHLARHDERLLHALTRLGRRLEEEIDVVLLCEFLTRLPRYFPLCFSVFLVAHEYDDRVGFGLLADFRQPVRQIREGQL
jgi:hypothetical protein